MSILIIPHDLLLIISAHLSIVDYHTLRFASSTFYLPFIQSPTWNGYSLSYTALSAPMDLFPYIDLHYTAVSDDQLSTLYLSHCQLNIIYRIFKFPLLPYSTSTKLQIFFTAVMRNHTNLLKLLLRHSDVLPHASSNFALTIAVQQGHLQSLILLLNDSRVDPTCRNNFALEITCKNGFVLCFQAILNHQDIDPSYKDNHLICFAASIGQTDCLRLLLNHHAVDPTTQNNYPIRIAAKEGHLDCLKLLLDDPRVDPT
ncbi:hypothetical protein HDV02_006107, partial [Globomyces sp. JEL0801]